jgi:hypothetical protein
VHFLTRPEIEAILVAPDRATWLGRRRRLSCLRCPIQIVGEPRSVFTRPAAGSECCGLCRPDELLGARLWVHG